MCFALMFHVQCINRRVCVCICAEEHIAVINLSVVRHIVSSTVKRTGSFTDRRSSFVRHVAPNRGLWHSHEYVAPIWKWQVAHFFERSLDIRED